MQYIQLHPQIASEVPSPQGGTLNFFLDAADNFVKIKTDEGVIVTSASPYLTGGTYNNYTITFTDNFGSQVPISGLTGIYLTGGTFSNNSIILNDSNNDSITITGLSSNAAIEIAYSGLVNTITTSGLTPGAYYLITDFKTCYDQPDFNYDGNSITSGNYKEAEVEPILVLATSDSTISEKAYQPKYPNDSIKYDWTYDTTEVTGGVAYGRITERIDEFNNRTDYDHRTILFKRYHLFTLREGLRLNGTIAINNTNLNNVTGTTTQFTNLSVGDVIYVPSMSPNYYEITNISSDTLMTITGDTLSSFGSGFDFYKTIEETNDSGGYFSIRQMNVKTNDFAEYTTFGDAIANDYAKNNYIGNYANNYQNVGNGTFLLANNVFLEGQYESNKFGDYCYNNTFGTDNQNNVWGDYCYENVSTNDIDGNIIGHYFYRNLINDNFQNNHIGNYFYDNKLLAENEESFEYNIIGNYFNNNTIYSWFHKNEILNEFYGNVIGDFGNLTNFEFSRNRVGNYFYINTIRQNFYDNIIDGGFYGNTLNGNFYRNVIGYEFNGNQNIGHDFYNNNIGIEAYSNQTIGDYFNGNNIGNYFNNNKISLNFQDNQINNNFENNTFGQTQYFNWIDTTIENLTGRTYDTFYESLGGNNNVGNVILGKELIMHDTVNNEYHKVKFTQWTQNGNGGGFSYERTKIYPTQESTVYFTKTNYGNQVDIIVEGSLEITRGNNGAIYNIAEEANWNNNVSPFGTEWNSIYTQVNNGDNFRNNKIGDYFSQNTISNEFRHNKIGDQFENNIIGEGFGFGYNTSQGNVIGNYFYDNTIGEYFYNNTIIDGFYNNQIFNNFQLNNIKTPVFANDFTQYYTNISAFTYTANGSTASDNTYTNLEGTTNDIGVDASFDIVVSGNVVTNVSINNIGKYYAINDTITILGTQIGGYSNSIDTFTDNGIGKNGSDNTYNGLSATGGTGINATFDVSVNSGLVDGVSINNRGIGYEINDELVIIGSLFGGTDGVDDITITVTALLNDDVVITITGVTPVPTVYEQFNCEIFKNSGNVNRLSFYDENDILTITDINE